MMNRSVATQLLQKNCHHIDQIQLAEASSTLRPQVFTNSLIVILSTLYTEKFIFHFIVRVAVKSPFLGAVYGYEKSLGAGSPNGDFTPGEA